MAKQQRPVVEYRIYDLPLDFPAMLLHGEEWRISDVLSGRLHFHNCLEIGVCHTDSGFIAFEDGAVSFQAGDVTVIPRHIPHTTCSNTGTRSLWSYLFVDIDRLLGPDAPSQSVDRHHVFSREQHPRMHFFISCIVEEMQMVRPDCLAIVRPLLLVLVHELIRLQAAGTGGKASMPGQAFRLKPALEHIASHYRHAITVDLLATMCGLSTTHFRRMFLSVVGASPLRFLNNTRINRACALLSTTPDSILSIADTVGFSTISSFNRYFAKVMGTSPRAYRDLARRDGTPPLGKQVVRQKGWLKPDIRPAIEAEGREDARGPCPLDPHLRD